ncbi:MAG: MOSC domain-containing protein [Phycisphaerales bacterium]|jgi:MOSC domain-containing protein YiiM|nr:MOSC domain-containing protein [PVC group bacterium]MDP6692683.1 MOSC domain-containing protein [Phycisphaerales bacterium]
MAIVLSVNVSTGGIPKIPVEKCCVTVDGLAGDGRDHDKHVCSDRAVSLIDREVLDQLSKEGYEVCPGAVGENLTVEELDVQSLSPGDMLTFSGGLVIELVESRRPCFVLDPLGEELKKDIVGRCGYLAKVIVENEISPGETITVSSKN